MDNEKQTAIDDFRYAAVSGFTFAGTVFMWIMALPWLLFGAITAYGVITGPFIFRDAIAGGLLIGAGLMACPPSVQWLMEKEVEQGRKPRGAGFFLAGYLVLAFAGIVVLVTGTDGASGAPQLGADVATPHAQHYQTIGPIETFNAPPGKLRVKVVVQSDAVTFEQRAHTAMAAALAAVKGGATDVLVWVKSSEGKLVAVADYFPYGETAWGKPAAHVWEVSADDVTETPDYLAPYLRTEPGDYSH